MIIPITQNQLLSLPVSRLQRLFDYVSKNFGIDEFLDYFLETDEGKELLADIKNRLSSATRE
jgi:hypothetical protein